MKSNPTPTVKVKFSKLLEPPITVSLVYSSETEAVSTYTHSPAPKGFVPTAKWLEANMGGQRFWDVALLVSYPDNEGNIQLARTDVFNTKTKGNTCTHEDLRELLNTEHASLAQEVLDEGFTPDALYWVATPNSPYVSDNRILQILDRNAL